MLFAYVVHLGAVSEYRLNIAQAQEIPLDSGVTNEVCFILGSRGLLCCYSDTITAITMCSSCSTSTLQNFNPVDLAWAQIFHIMLFYIILCPHRDVTSHLICINQNLV